MTVFLSRALILLFIALVHSLQWELKIVWLSWFAIQRIGEKKKKHIQPNLLHRAVGSMHKIEKIRQLCNISEVSFREYNLLLKCSHLVKTLLS